MKKKILFFLPFILMISCQSYDQKLHVIRSDVIAEKYDLAVKEINNFQGDEPLLSLIENARVFQIAGDWENSQIKFAEAIQILKERDNEAEYTVSGGARNVGSVTINDKMLRYDLSGFEEVLVYTYQALNFIMQNDFEGANVEIKRALMAQRTIEKKYADEITKKSENEKSITDSKVKTGIALKTVHDLAKTAKSAYENSFTYGLAAELAKPLNNDDYEFYVKKTKEVLGDSKNRLMVKRLGNAEKYGKVIFILDYSFIPMKKEVLMMFPTGAGISSFAFASYEESKNLGFNSFDIRIDNSKEKIFQLVNLQAIAYKNYEERFPAMMARMVVRVAAKVALQHAARHATKNSSSEAQLISWLGSTIFNLASERADTRSWTMLPAGIGMATFELPVGKKSIYLQNSTSFDLEIKSNHLTFVYLRNINGKVFYSTVNIRP